MKKSRSQDPGLEKFYGDCRRSLANILLFCDFEAKFA
jgi:hypothetical protein